MYTNLGMIACFEEWCYTDEADLIVPHHSELAFGGIIRDAEDVLKDCEASVSVKSPASRHGL